MNAIPTVTKNLLIINVLVFLATIVAQSYHLDLARYLGLHFFLADDFNVAQLITYMFSLTCLPCGCLVVYSNKYGDPNVFYLTI